MTVKQLWRRPTRARRFAVVVFLLAVVPTGLFGLRTYGSYELLRSAYQSGAPKTSNIRPWMTLDYIASSYRVPPANLIAQLDLPSSTRTSSSLKSLAAQTGLSPFAYVQSVQRAVAAIEPERRSNGSRAPSNWLGALADRMLTALLIYGYPVLAVTLFFGAIGLPLPAGIVMTVAGSLASQGQMNWLWAVIIAVIASVLGDAVGYGLGRLLGEKVIERHGHWFGYTSTRRDRVRALFGRWGSLTVFITRTFVSYLSSVASLLAGMSRYRLPSFLAIAITGRLVWTAGYFGLGYGIGADWEAATGFLTNLSILLVLLIVLIASGFAASGKLNGSPRSSRQTASTDD